MTFTLVQISLIPRDTKYGENTFILDFILLCWKRMAFFRTWLLDASVGIGELYKDGLIIWIIFLPCTNWRNLEQVLNIQPNNFPNSKCKAWGQAKHCTLKVLLAKLASVHWQEH